MTTNIFELISNRTKWLTQRQTVLSQNIANADTPDFEALDLKEVKLRELKRLSDQGERRLSLAQTHPSHVQGRPMPPMGILRAQEIDSFEVSPTGNSVVLEEQVGKMSSTRRDYQLMTTLYRKYIDMTRTALGRNG